MLSNNFWYGFLMGAFLVFGVFLLTHLFTRARTNDDPTSTPPTQPHRESTPGTPTHLSPARKR